MADTFGKEQARRLFGFIAAGGRLGALLDPTLTATLAVPLGPVNLLPVSALFLEIAVQCLYRLLRAPAVAKATRPRRGADRPVSCTSAVTTPPRRKTKVNCNAWKISG